MHVYEILVTICMKAEYRFSVCVCVCLLPSWLKNISVGNNCKANQLDPTVTNDGTNAEATPLTGTTVGYFYWQACFGNSCVRLCVSVRHTMGTGWGFNKIRKTTRPWPSPLAVRWLEGRVMRVKCRWAQEPKPLPLLSRFAPPPVSHYWAFWERRPGCWSGCSAVEPEGK